MKGRRIDLTIDPPPDLAVEVDFTSPSDRKLGIYGCLGVPELWRYAEATVTFYSLQEDSYAQVNESPTFAGVTPELIAGWLEQGLSSLDARRYSTKSTDEIVREAERELTRRR